MKTTLQFSDEEHNEAKMAIHAADFYCGLWSASEGLRNLLKYRDDLAFTEAQEDAIRNVMGEMQVTLDICE